MSLEHFLSWIDLFVERARAAPLCGRISGRAGSQQPPSATTCMSASSSGALTKGRAQAWRRVKPVSGRRTIGRAPDPVLTTLFVCGLALGAFGWCVALVTEGFERWTFEELRRAAAARGDLRFPETVLRDGRGHRLSPFAAARPSAYLVDFIYTRCPSVCQALGSEFYQMQEALRHRPGNAVRLLSISIDPLRDDAPALAAYGNEHHADPAFWRIAAPATPSSSAQLLSTLGVVAVPDGLGGFVHNGGIHLVDQSGSVQRVFDYAQWRDALVAAQQLPLRPHR